MHYGVKSLISVHNPSVELYQASMSEMWVQNGWGDQLNGLQAGWIVSPELNEDNHTRLFVLSTRDGYNTSCFTTLCNHFVQTSGTYPVDSELTQISIYEGDEYTLELSIYRDNVTSNWWLLAKGTEKIGYWPKELFPQLNDGALYVAWGGLVTSPPNHPSAPMGNGRRPVDPLSFKRAAYFRDLHVVDASSAYKDPDEKEFQVYTDDRSYCYGMVNAGYVQTMGHTILYGGPGGNDCGP
ncbi:hypothetical protein IFM89_022130 [Coptis chinensis]|uniref:Neprosin PEP catalytic domain-containing protein n=1 Tax=Coptis chinensis TaxID=261450 RepID=A0A835IX52_9MAGN|nr:hypothetical protein IFM89_022130 [Coptis chinensis]